MAAAEQNSILQVFPEYVARKLESMSARQFRDARKSLVAFLKGDISAQGLISHLDGKKPKAVLCSEQDKAYLLRIKKLLLQGSNANS
ncbi:MAG: hypothetical protein LLF76_04675 [Planctomycetaceae bacterium]|nr:hypothetical protein [Planctomycetaceae bacterium]